MSPTSLPHVRLRHILQHIDAIMAVTQNRSADEIVADYVMQRALERAVEIISEAAKSLPSEIRQQEPDVPWSDIISIGNMLRHEYYRIREDVMINILNTHLPQLRPAILRLLTSIEPGTDQR